jgi:hypothetical protein
MKNKYLYLKILVFILFLVGFFITSCVKDEYKLQNLKTPGWDPNFAAPLINSRLSIWDIANDYDSANVLIQNDSGFVYFVYTGRIFSQTAEELIQISDQSMNANYTFSTIDPIPVGDSLVKNFTFVYDFDFQNNQIIDSLFLKAGTLNVSLNTANFTFPAKFELTLPGTKNGQPFREQIILNSPNLSHDIDLSNSKLIFNHIGGNNRLELNFRFVIFGSNNPNWWLPYDLSISNSFSGMQFEALFGYLGQLNFALNEDTITVKVYDNNIEGLIQWENPKFFMTVTNYLGMPIKVDINYLEAIRTKPPYNSVQISGPGIPNPWNILYPNFSQIGQGVQTPQMELNRYNSNIDQAFNISPQQINALLNAVSNPSGITQNFTLDTSRFIVDARVELPLHGTADGFVILDTIPVNLGDDFKNADYIEWVLFKIFCENGFPVDALLQIYFTDENYVIVDSLLTPLQQFIHAATPGPPPHYLVTQKYSKTISTKVPKERIAEYNRIQHAIVLARMNTYKLNNTAQIVKLYSFYQMHVMLGAQVQLKF